MVSGNVLPQQLSWITVPSSTRASPFPGPCRALTTDREFPAGCGLVTHGAHLGQCHDFLLSAGLQQPTLPTPAPGLLRAPTKNAPSLLGTDSHLMLLLPGIQPFCDPLSLEETVRKEDLGDPRGSRLSPLAADSLQRTSSELWGTQIGFLPFSNIKVPLGQRCGVSGRERPCPTPTHQSN